LVIIFDVLNDGSDNEASHLIYKAFPETRSLFIPRELQSTLHRKIKSHVRSGEVYTYFVIWKAKKI
jgi:hypothetical protein